ncbi:hypothetical protein VF14_03485 [Nostoc linckia z18]|uniref:Uncharacterized protein n=2 Tax=Nostoc linckia TaxID=92942 RepID=A0A9Q6ENC9_NOSLI|nr:hypothetical protein [Nostoc linckia]PHK41442.1 hypothetical protein VF12_06465 [Nostoc linckia z15]PHK46943.1 hypothetical protein VF13_08125 [Nostoc linckia z16]PHJ69205.1 hypothetical protein VF02_00955 [Nostoc linckia z1]PHJ73356.1 hypothetical protein VF05_01970 [Nostoc linckia z3]PHJ78703.1 hypothetical protein VF03_00955 [Nostoc linckia z2]
MISKIRGLQSANPKFGFTCAVDVPRTNKVAGFLTHIKTPQRDVWQTHHLEEFKSMTQAARYLVEEYERMRSDSRVKQLIKLESILWFYGVCKNQRFNVNNLSESQLILATTILDQRRYLLHPDIRHSYWLPANSESYQMRLWDIANPWVKPLYWRFTALDEVSANRNEKAIASGFINTYKAAVYYLYYQI